MQQGWTHAADERKTAQNKAAYEIGTPLECYFQAKLIGLRLKRCFGSFLLVAFPQKSVPLRLRTFHETEVSMCAAQGAGNPVGLTSILTEHNAKTAHKKRVRVCLTRLSGSHTVTCLLYTSCQIKWSGPRPKAQAVPSATRRASRSYSRCTSSPRMAIPCLSCSSVGVEKLMRKDWQRRV